MNRIGQRYRVTQNRFRRSNEDTNFRRMYIRLRQHTVGETSIAVVHNFQNLYFTRPDLIILLSILAQRDMLRPAEGLENSILVRYSSRLWTRILSSHQLHKISGLECAICNVSCLALVNECLLPGNASLFLVTSSLKNQYCRTEALLWSSIAIHCLMSCLPVRQSRGRSQPNLSCFLGLCSERVPPSFRFGTVKGSGCSTVNIDIILYQHHMCFSFFKLSVLQSITHTISNQLQ